MKVAIPRRVGRALGRPLFALLAGTWRIQIEHDAPLQALIAAGRPYVLMCWHETLLPCLWEHRGKGIAAVVSEARDGQYLADFAAATGYRLVRGSSTRGATRALLGAVRELRAGHPVAFTPDGPRGPRRGLKPGVIAAAQRGQATLVPMYAEAYPAWRAGSWDRLLVPKPFSQVRVTYGPPFEVAPGEAGMREGIARATAALAQLVRGSRWPDDVGTPTG